MASMVTLVKLLKGVLLLALSLGAANQEILVDASYVVLTGYSRCELEELSYLSESELEQRIGLAQVPRGPWTLLPRYCELPRHTDVGVRTGPSLWATSESMFLRYSCNVRRTQRTSPPTTRVWHTLWPTSSVAFSLRPIERGESLGFAVEALEGDRFVFEHDGDLVANGIEKLAVLAQEPAVDLLFDFLPVAIHELPASDLGVDPVDDVGYDERHGLLGLGTAKNVEKLIINHGT